MQSLSTSQEIHITGPVIESPAVATILQKEAIRPIQKEAALRGIADKIVVYEIPCSELASRSPQVDAGKPA